VQHGHAQRQHQGHGNVAHLALAQTLQAGHMASIHQCHY
jgi:hypothetical protein